MSIILNELFNRLTYNESRMFKTSSNVFNVATREDLKIIENMSFMLPYISTEFRHNFLSSCNHAIYIIAHHNSKSQIIVSLNEIRKMIPKLNGKD